MSDHSYDIVTCQSKLTSWNLLLEDRLLLFTLKTIFERNTFSQCSFPWYHGTCYKDCCPNPKRCCVLLRSRSVLSAYSPGKVHFSDTGDGHEAATFFHIGSPCCKKMAKSKCWKTLSGEITAVWDWWCHRWWTTLAISSERMGSDRQHFSEGEKSEMSRLPNLG